MKRLISFIFGLILSGNILGCQTAKQSVINNPPTTQATLTERKADEEQAEIPTGQREFVAELNEPKKQEMITQEVQDAPETSNGYQPTMPSIREEAIASVSQTPCEVNQFVETPLIPSVFQPEPTIAYVESSESIDWPVEETLTTEPPGEVEALPLGCSHSWQTIEHPETGHEVSINSCGCGFQFTDIGAYDAHVSQYAGTAEMFTVHGHWGTSCQWVVDSPAWSEQQCSLCGETR